MRISWAACPGRSFDEFFASVRRRWPVSTAGSDFEDTARQAWARAIEKDRIERERFERQRRAAPPPPSPQSRRLAVIRRMAGAPPDPDEMIEAGQRPALEDRRRRVYISGPLTSSGNVPTNLACAVDAARALIAAGFAPFCPHLTCHVDPAEEYPHSTWMEIELPWVSVADAVLRLPGESVGAEIEVACAEQLGIPVFATVADLASHFAAAGSGDLAAATQSNPFERLYQ